MYGFGDVQNPAADSIAVMDDLVIDYIMEMVMSVTYAILSTLSVVSKGEQGSREQRQSACRRFQICTT